MKVRMEATNPGEIEFTLTATMTLKDWLTLRERLSGEYAQGIHAIAIAISDLTYQAQRTFRPEESGE